MSVRRNIRVNLFQEWYVSFTKFKFNSEVDLQEVEVKCKILYFNDYSKIGYQSKLHYLLIFCYCCCDINTF